MQVWLLVSIAMKSNYADVHEFRQKGSVQGKLLRQVAEY